MWPSKPPDFDQKQPSTLRAENGEVKYKHAWKNSASGTMKQCCVSFRIYTLQVIIDNMKSSFFCSAFIIFIHVFCSYFFCSAKTYSTRQCSEHDPCTYCENPSLSHSPTVFELKNMLEKKTEKHTAYHSSTASSRYLKFWLTCWNLLLAPLNAMTPQSAVDLVPTSILSQNLKQRINISGQVEHMIKIWWTLQESFGYIIEN